MERPRHLPYSWIIVALSFVTVSVSTGVRQSIIILFPALLDEFQWSRTVLSVAPSLAGAFASLGGLLIGALADRLDLRKIIPAFGVLAAVGIFLCGRIQSLWQLYLFYGVFVSIGINGLGVLPHTLIITRWFPERRGTIIGVVNAGFGAGMVVFMPLMQRIAGRQGWRNGYITLAAVLAVLIPLILIFQRSYPPTQTDKRKKEIKKPPDLTAMQFLSRLFRLPRYWLCYAQHILGPLSTSPIIIHQAALFRDRGLQPLRISWIVATYGIGMMIGMLVGGSLSDRIGREKSYTIGTVCLLIGCLSLLLMRDGDVTTPVVYALTFGFGMGTRPSMDAATAADLFKDHRFGLVFGTFSTALGIGQFIGPVLAGFVFDTTGSYQGAIIFCMIAAVVATGCIWLVAPRRGPVKNFLEGRINQ